MTEQTNNPKKPVIYYWIMSILLITIFNSLFLPTLSRQQVREVDYGTFLGQLEGGKVSDVQLEDGKLLYLAKGDDNKDAVFSTGAWEDPEIVNRLHGQGVRFTRVVPKMMSPLANILLTWILPMLIFFGIWRLISGRVMNRGLGGKNAMTFGKANAKVYVKAESGKNFADVAGQDEAKAALTEMVDFLKNPEKYQDIGAVCPKGALLVGPPGTGKTLLAKAVAGEANVPFFSISGSEFVEMFIGMGAAKVRDLFAQANEKAPCIVFIDEIDTIGKKRDNSGMMGNDEREQTLNQLLSEMDGFDGRKGVVILAATNRPESLDPALLRAGRFDRRIPVELPDLPGRKAILAVHAKRVKMDPKVDFGIVARATAGASGADLENIVNEAALRAVRMGRGEVILEDLEESVETVIAGQQRKNAVISPREKEIVSYHEIGHALAAAMQSDSAPVHKITIVPRTSGALGYTMQIEEEERSLMTREQLVNQLVVLAGGRAAEEVVFKTRTSGASNDIERATKLARAAVGRFGMDDDFGMVAFETVQNQYLGGDATLSCSPETAAKIDAAVIALVKSAHAKATEIMTANEGKLHELAKYLLEKETITGEEFMDILRTEK